MLRGEVNPGGVAVAKASPKRACVSFGTESCVADPKRSDLPMARVKRR